MTVACVDCTAALLPSVQWQWMCSIPADLILPCNLCVPPFTCSWVLRARSASCALLRSSSSCAAALRASIVELSDDALASSRNLWMGTWFGRQLYHTERRSLQ
jgi:hypothetical protein